MNSRVHPTYKTKYRVSNCASMSEASSGAGMSPSEPVAAATRSIFNAPDLDEAESLLAKAVESYAESAPKVSAWMETNILAIGGIGGEAKRFFDVITADDVRAPRAGIHLVQATIHPIDEVESGAVIAEGKTS